MELFSLGAANVAGSLFGGYPVAGGFSRTAVNDRAGARTPLAGLITSATVAIVVWKFTPVLYSLPQATLAAMIMSAVFGLIDLSLPKRYFKEDKGALVIWVSTCSSTLLLGLQIGILIGVALSFIAHLLKTLSVRTTPDQAEPNHA
jgi:SulP family sulfate permease